MIVVKHCPLFLSQLDLYHRDTHGTFILCLVNSFNQLVYVCLLKRQFRCGVVCNPYVEPIHVKLQRLSHSKRRWAYACYAMRFDRCIHITPLQVCSETLLMSTWHLATNTTQVKHVGVIGFAMPLLYAIAGVPLHPPRPSWQPAGHDCKSSRICNTYISDIDLGAKDGHTFYYVCRFLGFHDIWLAGGDATGLRISFYHTRSTSTN